MGNSFFTYIQVHYMMIGIFLWCTTCFWAYMFGEFPRSVEYLFRPEFWWYRYFNLSEGDRVKAEYMGYGIGLSPLIMIPCIAVIWLFQPIANYFAMFHLYPEEYYWLNNFCFFLAFGIANFCQWTREQVPLTYNMGADRMIAFVLAFIFLGFYINVRGQILGLRQRQLKSKELALKAVIYAEDIMEEEE